MKREVDLVSYLPPFLQEYKEQNTTLAAENPEFTIMWDAVNRILYNEFIATADEYGISRYEKILKILPFKEDTLESRRARVQAQWFVSLPYTMKMLLIKLTALCGEDNFTVTKQFTYQIRIETSLELFGQVAEVERLLNEVMPCNIVVVQKNNIPAPSDGIMFYTGVVTCAEIYNIS